MISFGGRHFHRVFIVLVSTFLLVAGVARTQTIRVDTTPSRAIPFDPDKALGTSLDILPAVNFNEVFSEPNLKKSLSAGWGPISYRQNTELTIEAWHWNPTGNWSDPAHQDGYFTGSATPGADPIRESFGYSLPHRGTTRGDAGANEYSRLTDGDVSTYWKSNPYLTKPFTGQDDDLLPQWIVIDFGSPQTIDAIRIDWANPYATHYDVEYWTGEDAMNKPAAGYWTVFPTGGVQNGKGGTVTLELSDIPIVARFLRIRMTQSSNTCDTHGAGDPRNCVGYAVNELYAGNFTADRKFIDVIKHRPGQAQTTTWVSSVDPWHTAADRVPARIQTGFDLFFTSGLTNHLPAMIPIAMIYATPEDSAAEIAYIEKRGYPISYVEMGEEPDGAFMTPEDYAALYIQWAAALDRVDPKLKLGGPVFTGADDDITAWPDDQGRASWLGRFVDYLKARGRLNDLSFMSFEHYPFTPCQTTWTDLYREPEITRHILEIWRDDGVPAKVPLIISESNVSWALTDPMQDTFSALWLADSVGSFLANGGALYTHSPIQPEPLRPGCHAFSTYGNFVADRQLHILQYTAQYFASRMINFDWVQHGDNDRVGQEPGEAVGRRSHPVGDVPGRVFDQVSNQAAREVIDRLYPAESNLRDDASHDLVTAYAVKRPDGEWSLMLINKDPTNAHSVHIDFGGSSGGPSFSPDMIRAGVSTPEADPAEPSAADSVGHFTGPVSITTFGADQYAWHPDGPKSYADPDGPPVTSTIDSTASTAFALPRASLTILRGHVE
jgi:F5/8 type C domain